MSDERAFEQASAELAYAISVLFPQRIENMPKQPASPIERSLLIGLMAQSLNAPMYDFGDRFSELTVRYDRDDRPTFRVELQAQVLNYRADFLITVILSGKTLGRVVIECDGHHFHERTKEQAAHDRGRDRAMTLAGYKVIRFTGSEIHRDLMKCVNDAHYAAWHFFATPEAASDD